MSSHMPVAFRKVKNRDCAGATSYRDVKELFDAIDTDGSGCLDRTEVGDLAIILGINLSGEELSGAFQQMDQTKNERVDLQEFDAWCECNV